MSDTFMSLAPAGGIYDDASQVCMSGSAGSDEFIELLEIVGSGGALGTGWRLNNLGLEIPTIRTAYQREIDLFVREIDRRAAAGMRTRELARWAVVERARIAHRIRATQGVGARAGYALRDTVKYGFGGRTYANMVSHYSRKGLAGDALHEALLKGAKHPNAEISAGAIKGARYLRQGGRVLLIVSAATSAYTILTTPKRDMERVIHEEVGAFGLGAAASGAAVGLCLVFGVATGGFGLLACGVLGGIAGGAIGSYAGDRLYFATHDETRELETTGLINPKQLREAPVCQ